MQLWLSQGPSFARRGLLQAEARLLLCACLAFPRRGQHQSEAQMRLCQSCCCARVCVALIWACLHQAPQCRACLLACQGKTVRRQRMPAGHNQSACCLTQLLNHVLKPLTERQSLPRQLLVPLEHAGGIVPQKWQLLKSRRHAGLAAPTPLSVSLLSWNGEKPCEGCWQRKTDHLRNGLPCPGCDWLFLCV